MSFESIIADLGKELSLKHPVEKRRQTKANDSERRLELVSKIQSIIREIIEDISKWKFPVFKVAVHNEWDDSFYDGRINAGKTKIKRIDFKRCTSRAEFTRIVFLLSKIHKLLLTEQSSTRRELYYKNLHVFKSQKQVDYGMRMICHVMEAPTWELRVLATSKGVVAGPVVLTLANGDLVDCSKQGGVSVPQNVLEITTISTSATWVLIVEKDASFQRLATTEVANRLGPCILMTGKGFPDVNSRILVCKLWELLRIPILTLVDADPHGFEIMCVYRFGSLSMSSYSPHLACPAVRWLGVHPGDIRPLLLDSKPLSLNDLNKIRSLLKRPYVEADHRLRAQATSNSSRGQRESGNRRRHQHFDQLHHGRLHQKQDPVQGVLLDTAPPSSTTTTTTTTKERQLQTGQTGGCRTKLSWGSELPQLRQRFHANKASPHRKFCTDHCHHSTSNTNEAEERSFSNITEPVRYIKELPRLDEQSSRVNRPHMQAPPIACRPFSQHPCHRTTAKWYSVPRDHSLRRNTISRIPAPVAHTGAHKITELGTRSDRLLQAVGGNALVPSSDSHKVKPKSKAYKHNSGAFNYRSRRQQTTGSTLVIDHECDVQARPDRPDFNRFCRAVVRVCRKHCKC